nr:hypothetical protein TQ38_05230 [Novosphingobium sp. P6W]
MDHRSRPWLPPAILPRISRGPPAPSRRIAFRRRGAGLARPGSPPLPRCTNPPCRRRFPVRRRFPWKSEAGRHARGIRGGAARAGRRGCQCPPSLRLPSRVRQREAAVR